MFKKMKLLSLLIIVFAGLSFPLDAVSPFPESMSVHSSEFSMGAGSVICLSQSGTSDVFKMICVNDILIVYHENNEHVFSETGKIKILSFIRSDYLRCKIVEGTILVGDIAIKGTVASIVISPADRCE